MFKGRKAVIGMIHVDALPGTPRYGGSMKRIIEHALGEARIYKEAGIDVIGVENMHDIPYLNRQVGPEITAAMAVVAHEVKHQTGLPCGMQILAGANQAALAAALAADLDFIRAEGFVFAHVADEGLISSDAGALLRYRKQIGADNIAVFTDIKKKHSSHALTADVDLAETAHAAEFFLSDGVVVTGSATGRETDLEDLTRVRAAVEIPVLVGSGVNLDNVARYLPLVDAMIVGSYFKRDGLWTGPVVADRVKSFMSRVKDLRRSL